MQYNDELYIQNKELNKDLHQKATGDSIGVILAQGHGGGALHDAKHTQR